MANVNDDPVYEAGIVKLETTTPVQGGADTSPSNLPLRQLGRRTSWLKQAIDGLMTALNLKAPINSPAFTGSATAPDVALGNRSQLIANTKFVQDTTGGVCAITVTGGTVSLTGSQAGYRVLNFSGTLTSDCTIVVPQAEDNWIVFNGTVGPYALRVKCTSGAGERVEQGRAKTLWCDTTLVVPADNDLRDAALTGAPTAPTPGTNDNSQRVATTAYVVTAVAGEANARNLADAGLVNDYTTRINNEANARNNADAALVTDYTNRIGNEASARGQADANKVDKGSAFSQLGPYALTTGPAGSVTFPDGTTLKWGQATTGADGIGVVNFVSGFANFCEQVIVCEGNAQGWFGSSVPEPTWHGVDNILASGFTTKCLRLRNGTPELAPASFRWWAVGR